MFVFGADASRSGRGNPRNPPEQPELAREIANWWGGDIAALAACWHGPTPHVLLADDFEPTARPVEPADELTAYNGEKVHEALADVPPNDRDADLNTSYC